MLGPQTQKADLFTLVGSLEADWTGIEQGLALAFSLLPEWLERELDRAFLYLSSSSRGGEGPPACDVVERFTGLQRALVARLERLAFEATSAPRELRTLLLIVSDARSVAWRLMRLEVRKRSAALGASAHEIGGSD